MFLNDVAQQPQAMRDLIAWYRGPEAAPLIDSVDGYCDGRDCTFVGMGASLYAAWSLLPRLWATGVPAVALEAGELLHFGLSALRPQGLVVAVSQSGRSAETLAVAEAACRNHPLVAITNDASSPLARAAAHTFPTLAGEEMAVSTKTFTNTLGVLCLLGGTLMEQNRETVLQDLDETAVAMDWALRVPDPQIEAAAAILDGALALHCVGRGPSLAAACQSALILAEGCHVAATALAGGSFRHGPLELAGPGHAALLFNGACQTEPLMDKLERDLLRLGSAVVTIRQGGDACPGSITFNISHSLPSVTFACPAIVLVERMVAAVARRRGLVPGRMRYGGKVTLEE